MGSSRTREVLGALAQAANTTWMASLASMSPACNLDDFVCVVVSDDTTDESSLNVLAQIRSERPHLPILLVTDTDDMADAVAAMRLGATRVVEIPPCYDLLRQYVVSAANLNC
jgi:DNA-binding NtrC family response regulator